MLTRRNVVFLSSVALLGGCSMFEKPATTVTSGGATTPQLRTPAPTEPVPAPPAPAPAPARSPTATPGVKGHTFYRRGRHVNKSHAAFTRDLFDRQRQPKEFYVDWATYRRELNMAGFEPTEGEVAFRKFIESAVVLDAKAIRLEQFEMGMVLNDGSIAYYVRKTPYAGEKFLAWRINRVLTPGISLGCGNILRMLPSPAVPLPPPPAPKPGRINCPPPGCPEKK